MEAVEVVAALGAGIVLVVIVSVLVHRRRSGEAQSVAGYRRTLDVLGQVAEGEAGGARSLEPPTSHPPKATPYERSSEAARARSSDPASGAVDRWGTAARRDRSLLAMEHPAHRFGAPLAALLVVLVVAGGAAYLVVRTHHVTPASKQSTSAGSRRRTPSTKRKHTAHTSPTTTAPHRYTAVSSTASSATYVPATSTYSLTVGATTADCWMSVTSASGTTVLEQTFAPGASVSLSLTGRSTILLGAPKAAEVSIGGVPVVLPSGIPGPYTVTLSPA